MTGGWSALGADVEGFVDEDEVLADARTQAVGSGGPPVSQGVGTALRFLAAAVDARAVVEVGTGTGVSGLWLLRGMAADGTLTTIDVDPEQQRVARALFTAAGNGSSRLRLINGMGLEVLPRLTDGGYDLVFVDAEPADHPRYLDESVRLLRPGGIVVLHGVLDQTDAALPEVADAVRRDERLTPVLLPLGAGLLAAVKRAR